MMDEKGNLTEEALSEGCSVRGMYSPQWQESGATAGKDRVCSVFLSSLVSVLDGPVVTEILDLPRKYEGIIF